MLPILNQIKNQARIAFPINGKISSYLITKKRLFPKKISTLSSSSLTNSYVPRYSFSGRKYPSPKQGQKKKIYVRPIYTPQTSAPRKLLTEIQTFLHKTSTPSQIKILNECQTLQGFINNEEMTTQIMDVRKYILQEKYQEIKKLSTIQLYEVLQGIKQNYSLTAELFKEDRLIKDTDFDNGHCQLAVLTYFTKLFLMVPLLEKAANQPEDSKRFEKWQKMYIYIAFSVDQKYNIISQLKKDSIFYSPDFRFKYVVKEEVMRRMGEWQNEVNKVKGNERFSINEESAIIEEGILTILKTYSQFEVFKEESVKILEQILARPVPENLSAEQKVMHENGKNTIRFLKKMVENHAIMNLKEAVPLVVGIFATQIVAVSALGAAFVFMGNGPGTSNIGEYLDMNESVVEGQSESGGDGGSDFDFD